MIAIVDYGVGNLFSLRCSLEYVGARCVVTSDKATLASASKIILPGVGAFGDAAAALGQTGLDEAVVREAERGKPLFGICLGMQLLFEESCEHGKHKGLGLIPGTVESLSEAINGQSLKVPHMGWNRLESRLERHPLLNNVGETPFVYYVHSFYVPESEYTAAWSEYGTARVTGFTAKDNICGTQFHPEKSGQAGLAILRAFADC